MDHKTYRVTCPLCEAATNKARLEVVTGIFRAHAMFLAPDGFSFADAKQLDTQEEQVYCHACGDIMDLTECLIGTEVDERLK